MADEEALCIGDSCDRPINKQEMLQCAICAQLFHTECIGVTKKAKSLPFSCLSCRKVPKHIDEILTVMNTLLIKNSRLVDEVTALRNEVGSLRNENEKILVTVTELKKDNRDLLESVASISTNVQKIVWNTFRENDSNDKPKAGGARREKEFKELILSDSMLRLVDPEKLMDSKLVAIPNADIKKLTEEIEKPEYENKRYDRVVIMAGTNDLQNNEDDDDEHYESLQSFKLLIEKASKNAQEVTVSSVCPRLDDAGKKVAAFNTGLEGICDEKGCSFVDHTKFFTLSDETINDGYLSGSNGPHLSKAGLNRVVKSLNLKIKNGVTDVMKPYSPRSPTSGGMARNRQNLQNEKRDLRGVRFNHNGCVLCNEGGHNAVDCFHRNRGPVICRSCGIAGHKAKHHVRSHGN